MQRSGIDSRICRHAIALLSALAWSHAALVAGFACTAPMPVAAQAAPIEVQDPDAQTRATAAETLFAASATAAVVERLAEVHFSAQSKQIEGLQTRLKSVGARNTNLQAELTQAQERLVAELAEQDRSYAHEIAVIRRTVKDIVSMPEGEMALRQYNAGDQNKALMVLDRLVARKEGTGIEIAAAARWVAGLALNARAKGKGGTAAVIQRYEEVTRLDPGVQRDWVELGRLYREVGRLDDARQAAQRAADTASDDLSRALAQHEQGVVLVDQGKLAQARLQFQMYLDTARRLAGSGDIRIGLINLGDVLIAQKNLAGARTCYEQSLELAQRLVGIGPKAQRDVGLSLIRLGDVLVAEGDLAGAHQRFQEGLTHLAGVDERQVSVLRERSIGLNKLGNVLLAQGDRIGARARFEESLVIRKRLVADDPSLARARRDLSISLDKIGNVQLAQDDFASARVQFEESLRIRKSLVDADPNGRTALRDLSVSHENLGNVLLAQRDRVGARTHFEESLKIRKHLLDDVGSASVIAQRDVWVSMSRLVEFADSGITWPQIVAEMEGMQVHGVLPPSDVPYLHEARRQAQTTNTATTTRMATR